MYQRSSIENLFGRVGWRQSTLTNYDIVDAENLASASGYYFQDGSKLVTIKNLHETQENDSITDEQFNAYLTNLQKTCINNVLNKVFNGRSSFLSTFSLYPYEQDYSNTLTIDDKFRCFKIDVGRNNRVLSVITSCTLSFDANDTFNLYLYHSSKKAPIQTKSVTVVGGQDTKVILDWQLPLRTTEYNQGTYYIGYNESEVTAQPFERDYELANYQVNSSIVNIEPVYMDIDSTVLNIGSDNSSSDPYGINLELSSYTDYTDLITENKSVFDNAIMLQMAINVLEQIVFTTRSNITQRIGHNTQSLAFVGLNGDDNSTGLYQRISNEIKSLKKKLFPEDKQFITVATMS